MQRASLPFFERTRQGFSGDHLVSWEQPQQYLVDSRGCNNVRDK